MKGLEFQVERTTEARRVRVRIRIRVRVRVRVRVRKIIKNKSELTELLSRGKDRQEPAEDSVESGAK